MSLGSDTSVRPVQPLNTLAARLPLKPENHLNSGNALSSVFPSKLMLYLSVYAITCRRVTMPFFVAHAATSPSFHLTGRSRLA